MHLLPLDTRERRLEDPYIGTNCGTRIFDLLSVVQVSSPPPCLVIKRDVFKIENKKIEKNKLFISARMILDGKLGGTFSTAIVVILPFNEIVRGRG